MELVLIVTQTYTNEMLRNGELSEELKKMNDETQ